MKNEVESAQRAQRGDDGVVSLDDYFVPFERTSYSIRQPVPLSQRPRGVGSKLSIVGFESMVGGAVLFRECIKSPMLAIFSSQNDHENV